MSVEISITDQIVEINEVSNPVEINVNAGAAVAQWGTITGTLSNQTDLQNALNAKVPYTGATANVDLGEFELKAGQFEFDQTPTGVASTGVMRWNDTTGVSETTLKGGNVILRNGVDLVARVVNKVTPNTTLTKAAYQAVRVSGAQGQRLAVAFAQANNDANSADTIGLVTETIATNQEGFIMAVGQLENINTTGSLQGETWLDGDVLYLSPFTAGRITNIKPVAPNHIIVIGYVEYAHANNGKIYVKVMNGWELGELHDVDTTGAVAGNVLKYNGTIWTPSGDVGITSLNGLTATTQTFSLDTRGNDVAIVSSGSNHEFIFPSASSTRRGVLTSSDWSLFFNKIGGSGTIGTMPIFTGTGAIGNSIVNITNGLVNIDGVGNLSDYGLQIGTGRTNNGFAYIDLVGDTTYSDYGFRLMRNNTGANATSVIEHRGTGDFIFKTVDNANLYFQTGSTNRVFVEANSGALNVANSSAVFLSNTGEQLIVNGSAKFANTITANSLVKSGGTSSQYLMADGSTSTLTNPVTGTGVSGQVAYWSGTNTQVGSNNLFWDNTNARLGIGTNTPLSGLNLEGNNTSGTLTLSNSDTDISTGESIGQIDFYTKDGSAITNRIVASIKATADLIYAGGTAPTSLRFFTQTYDPTSVGFAATEKMRLDNAGNLGIGIVPTQKLDVSGSASYIRLQSTSTTADTDTSLFLQTFDGTSVSSVVSIGGTNNNYTFRDYGSNSGFITAARSGGLGLFATNASGVLRFYTGGDAASNKRMQIFANGNVLIQNGGTFTDSGQRLQVTGDTLLKGSGNTSATTALTVQNSDGTTNFEVLNDGIARFRTSIRSTTGGSQLNQLTASGTGTENGLSISATQTPTSGDRNMVRLGATFSPTSGGARLTNIYIASTINQTGGANGITRGLYIEPTLTAAADWRSIEWSNNTGWGLYGAGTGLNYLNGLLLLGSTISTGERLQVNGTIKVTGASTFGGNMSLTLNQNAATTFIITNTGSGTNTATQSQIKLTTDVGSLWLSKRHSLSAPFKTINGSDSYIYNDVGGNITILNDFATGNINMAAGGSSTAHFTIASTGAATFSSSVTSTQFRLSALNTAPATSSSTGTLGEIRIDADYIYICTATNTWKRVAIATW